MAEKKHDGEQHQGPAHASPYGLSTLAPSITLVDTAREIEKADEVIGTVVGGKLKVIADQIRALQAQAQEVLSDAQRDLRLHRATCSFVRRPGHLYHLYEKQNGDLAWSMLSPEDWGSRCPHSYQGSYRLEADQSWTPVEEIASRDEDPSVIRTADVLQRLLPGK